MKTRFLGALCAVLVALASPGAGAVVVVNNDEWTLSNTGYANAPADTDRFVSNLANLFSGGGSGTFHAYTSNFSFTQSNLAATLSGAGHTYTTGTAFAFTPENISGFDALFLGGFYLSPTEITTLINYANSGGNVYLAGGTGVGGAAAEAAAWNPFLNAFGLSYGTSYNGISGNIDVTAATHPIFDGVSILYQNNGNSVSGPGVQVSLNEQGLYAVVPAIPIPPAIYLFGTGLMGLVGMSRRKVA
jgi:hypothetical protein